MTPGDLRGATPARDTNSWRSRMRTRALFATVLSAAMLPSVAWTAQETPRPKPRKISPLVKTIRDLRIPGYTRIRIRSEGKVRPPAMDTLLATFRPNPKLKKADDIPKSIDITLVLAPDGAKAWKALRHRRSGLFALMPVHPGVVAGPAIQAVRVAHGVMLPPSRYSVAGVQGRIGVLVTYASIPRRPADPASDYQMRLTEEALRYLLVRSTGKATRFRRIRPRRSVTVEGPNNKQYDGVILGDAVYIAVEDIASDAVIAVRWESRDEALHITTAGDQIKLRLNSNETRVDNVPVVLHRPVRWLRGKACISLPDIKRVLGVELRRAQ